MRFFLNDGSYWATLTAPSTLPSALKIATWAFVPENDYYRAVADPTTVDPASFTYQGPLTYHVEDGVASL